MSKFLTLVDMIYKKGGGYEKMAESNAVLDTMFAELEKAHKPLYDKTMRNFEEIAFRIEPGDAAKIVGAMRPFGEKWSYETVQSFIAEKGITDHVCRWYLSMNMAYNDYYNTAKTMGAQDSPEFFFSIAKDFINDQDAAPFKVERYFLHS